MSFGVRKKGSGPTLHFIGWKKPGHSLALSTKLCCVGQSLHPTVQEHQHSPLGRGRDMHPSLPGTGLQGVRGSVHLCRGGNGVQQSQSLGVGTLDAVY